MWRMIRIAIPVVAVAGLATTLVATRGTDAATASELTRAELASLYRSLMPSEFQPPACVIGQERFTDVPASSQFCPWIEEMARRGITSGCTATKYCPGNPVNRAQMAVFVVKATETCPTLASNDEMIRVGGVCIDKYEASLWNHPTSTNPIHLITGTIPCRQDGQNCDNIWARSVAGVQPRAHINWFQAQAALTNSGKRLPTNAEWQMAVRGTPDSINCNVSTGSVTNTGSSGNCVSDFGAFDMVGNLWEWVADWVPASTDCTGWHISDDWMCLSGASTTADGPGALMRGGAFNGGLFAGPLAVFGFNQPSFSFQDVGFRGAR